MVGARGFEPPTSASRTLRANRTALRPAETVPFPFKGEGISMPLSWQSSNEKLPLQRKGTSLLSPAD